jgi:thiol:disulfide interchange protein DsbD
MGYSGAVKTISTLLRSRRAPRAPRALWALLAVLACVGPGPVTSAIAKPWWIRGSAADEDRNFLDPDVAFRVGAHLDADQLRVRWVIADGYYLYRQKLQVLAESPDLHLGPVQLPRGTMVSDEFLGTQEIYVHQVEASAHVSRDDYGAHPVQIKVVYQGCASAGFCYPAITRVLFPDSAAGSLDPTARTLFPWQLVAILGGLGAFLIAGLRLGKRRIPTPTSP